MQRKILIAEDENLTAELVADILGELGYLVRTAPDGAVALELFNREDFDLLVTDIQMPRMNGLDLIKNIRETPKGKEMAIVVATAYGQAEYAIKAVELGVIHFLLKPFEVLELKRTVSHCMEIITLREAKRKMEREKDLDLREAAYVQKTFMMPEEEAVKIARDAGLDLAVLYRPYLHTSGDFIWVKKIDSNRAAILLLDVCGHGTAAAMIGVRLFNFINSMDPAGISPKDFLSLMHRDALTMMPKGRFVACAYAVYDGKEKNITIANGANPAPMNGLTGEEIPVFGAPLGQRADVRFSETTIPFPPGARVLLFSDGIVEAQNPPDEMYGEERLSNLLKDSIDLPIGELKREIAADLEIFCEGRRVEDDVTVLILEAGK
ncbi:MAG: SpoIIE family protein phosphatase [Nitrospinae bacterium]|nr:SpoIIE family protein phosphatase [Nitrospinota bacterium]